MLIILISEVEHRYIFVFKLTLPKDEINSENILTHSINLTILLHARERENTKFKEQKTELEIF